MDYTEYYKNLYAPKTPSAPVSKVPQTYNRPQPVTVSYAPQPVGSDENPYSDVDYVREQNYDAYTELIDKTTSSRDTYTETASSISQAVVNALEPYTHETPIATTISSYLSEWLNTDKQSRIDDYNSAIDSCTAAREYV